MEVLQNCSTAMPFMMGGQNPSGVLQNRAALAASQVADVIRHAIMRADFAPGQRLVQVELSELLQTGRTAVREALNQLAHEGLVEHIGFRGARVRPFSLAEALDTIEVSQTLEVLLATRAAQQITDDEIRALQGLSRCLRDSVLSGRFEDFSDSAQQAFDAYVRIARQPIAAEMLEKLHRRTTVHRLRPVFWSGRIDIELACWTALIDAICDRDAAAACKALEHHVNVLRAAMTAFAERNAPRQGRHEA